MFTCVYKCAKMYVCVHLYIWTDVLKCMYVRMLRTFDKLYHWIYAGPAENRPKSLSAGRPKSDFDGNQ